MTLKEFKDKTKHHKDDWTVVIRKSDRDQLCCNTTVPVKSVSAGFDWTMNQVVLTPEIPLTTNPGTVDERHKRDIKMYSAKCARYMHIAAKLSMLISSMEDSDIKTKLTDTVKEFLTV